MKKTAPLKFRRRIKWFTLVELIVVTAILAILWTVGYLSYAWYAASSRDSVRVTDISTIKRGIGIYYTEKSDYPNPSNPKLVTYSGAGLWNEGTFGDAAFLQTRVTTPRKDPLTNSEYAYSLTTKRNEYQLGYALEQEVEYAFVPKAYALGGNMRMWATGNYNGKVLTASTWSVDYVLAVPTIITSDKNETDYLKLVSENKLAFRGFENLPGSYGTGAGNFTFSDPQGVVLYAWKLADLWTNQEDRLFFYKALSEAYNQSAIADRPDYVDYTKYYINIYNPTMTAINMACKSVNDLLKVKCTYGDAFEELALWAVETGALLPDGKTNYLGQWTFGDVFGVGQSIGTPWKERNTQGMIGWLNRSIGTKWKQFTRTKSPSLYLWGHDIDGDGKENVIYGYGGKIFLWDPKTGGNIWESKVLDIKAILWVEGVLADGSKSIIVALSTDWYVGVINGKTGNLDWVSENVSWPVKTVKPGWPGLDYKVFDVDGDGIKEYHFKQWYNKYHSYRFFEQSGKVVWETLWSSQGYGDYNAWSDGYQPQQWSMGRIDGKYVVGAKGSHSFSFYSSNVNPSLSGMSKFQMPWFGKNLVGGNTWAGWSSSLGYFYDLNGDGNDEYVYRIDEELNNNKLSRIWVIGYENGTMNQYFSVANPRIVDGSWALQSFWNFSALLPLRNASNPSDSYVLAYGRDPNDTATNKWMMFKYDGTSAAGHKKDSAENESFNYQVTYNVFDASFSVAGIFNNGNKDYVVLYKWGEYYFYTFNGTSSLLTPSPIKVAGSFYGNTLFDALHDAVRERNKNAGTYLAGRDSNGNGIKEFVVTSGNYFKYYEITDSWAVLLKQYWPYNVVPGVLKWGISTDDNLYGISYSSTTNAINYYKTDVATGNYSFVKMTDDNFYAGWEISDLVISKLWQWTDRYNKIMMSGVGMFDARNATPSASPTKLSSDFFYSYDMDFDGTNEVFIGGKAYTFNAPGNYTQKYGSTGWIWDLNGDGVADYAYSYCGSTPSIPVNLFFTIRSGADGSQIVPDIDWWNGNGYCSGWGSYSAVSEDFDKDGIEELVAGISARSTRILSVSWSSVTEWTPLPSSAEYLWLAAFDFDGDGTKEIVRWTNNSWVMKGGGASKTSLSTVANIPGDVKSTWGISGGMQSFYRYNGSTYVAFRWADWQVSLKSWNGSSVTNHFNYYYLNAKRYSSYLSVLNDGIVPMPSADVFLWDFIGNKSLQVLVWGGDGWIYIIALNGTILKAVDVWSAIKRMVIWDVNEDGIIDIVFSAEDGYVYQLGSSRIDPPAIIRDGASWTDISSQTERNRAGVSFSAVDGAKWYFVQLYNKTYKSIVFDWIDLWNKTSVCVTSNNVTDANCVKATKNFYLNNNSVYEWRVQSYNDDLTSSVAFSNGFVIK